MGWVLAIASRDPNLVGCALHSLKSQIQLGPAAEPEAYGMGYYQAGEPLLERQPTPRGPFDLYALAKDLESEVIAVHACLAEGTSAKDENTQPFRFRRWLFAHAGHVEGLPAVRGALLRALPDFLQRQLRGDTSSEIAFLYVLRHLRERGLADDLDAPAAALGRALREAIQDLERVLREQGAAKHSQLDLFLTNGRSVAATRAGGPLCYRPIEGLVPCAKCGLDERTPENHPSLRPHRRMRAVVLVTAEAPAGFVELPDRSVVTVSPELDIRVEAI